MKINKKIHKYLLIVLAMFFSYGFVSQISPQIFLANTPQINPKLIETFKDSPISIIAYLGGVPKGATVSDYVKTAQIPRANPPKDLEFLPIAKGVYAAGDPVENKTYVKIEKGTKLMVHTVKLDNGKTVKVYVPVE